MVSHILPGSPADAAGIAVGDYIYSVNGRPIEDPDQFDRYIREAESPLRLEVEHRGRIRTAEIPPSDSGQQVFRHRPMPWVNLAGRSVASHEIVSLQ